MNTTQSQPQTPPTANERFSKFWDNYRDGHDPRNIFVDHINEAAEQARREENESCAKLLEDQGYAVLPKLIRARITPPKPVWCEHILWEKCPPGGFGWVCHAGFVGIDWKQCPICLTKRPEGA